MEAIVKLVKKSPETLEIILATIFLILVVFY